MKLIVAAGLALSLPGFTCAQAANVERSASVVNSSEREGWLSVRHDGEPMITGSGSTVRHARPLGGFSAIRVQGPFDLEVAVGSRYSVEIAIDDNLTDRVGTKIRSGELQVTTEGSFRTRRTPLVRVTLPRLDKVTTQGNGDARIVGVNGGRLELVGQGSGDFVVGGRASSVTASLYGSGDADLTGIAAPEIKVAVYGSGAARAHATGKLSAAVFGSGRVEYSGSPSEVERSIHGSGRIERVGK